MVQLISASPRPARLNSASTELLILSASARSLKYAPSFRLSEVSSRVMIPVDPSSKRSALASSSASRETSSVTSHQEKLRIADCGLRISEVIINRITEFPTRRARARRRASARVSLQKDSGIHGGRAASRYPCEPRYRCLSALRPLFRLRLPGERAALRKSSNESW